MGANSGVVMVSRMDWHGVWPVVATPFTDDGAVDDASSLAKVSFLSQSGAVGLAVGGMTSETHKLTTEERRRIVEMVSHELDG